MNEEINPCEICKKDKNELFFLTSLPCSHCICLSCLSQIKDMRCPFCRKDFGLKLREVCPAISFNHQIRRSVWDDRPTALDYVVDYQSPRNDEERIVMDIFNSDNLYMNVWNRLEEIGF